MVAKQIDAVEVGRTHQNLLFSRLLSKLPGHFVRLYLFGCNIFQTICPCISPTMQCPALYVTRLAFVQPKPNLCDVGSSITVLHYNRKLSPAQSRVRHSLLAGTRAACDMVVAATSRERMSSRFPSYRSYYGVHQRRSQP